MQRTLKQINTRITKLKNHLKTTAICENFGDRQIRELDSFIGDIYSYSFNDRMAIVKEQREFANWCMHYTGH
jgi:deoxyadenosine/deoxycytidine kinase